MAFDNKQIAFSKDSIAVLDISTGETCAVRYESLQPYKNRNRYSDFFVAQNAFRSKLRIFLRQSFFDIETDELERLTEVVTNLLSERIR